MTTEQSVKAIGGGPRRARRELDFYPTPPECTVALMEFLKLDPMKIWEPAAGNGDMANVLCRYGHDVITTDISTGHDYLTETPFHGVQGIITNPPFSISQNFIEKALTEAPLVAMLLKAQYWHAAKRAKLYATNPPAFILPLTWRPDFTGQGASLMDMAWTVWIEGNTQCKYIPLSKPSKI